VLDLLDGHAVIEEPIEDGLADLVVVVGLGLDALNLSTEGGAAVAGGAILSGGDMKDEDGLVGDGSDSALVGAAFASSPLAAVRAGSVPGSVAAVDVNDLGARFGAGVGGVGKL
jgi:hypothetical protein